MASDHLIQKLNDAHPSRAMLINIIMAIIDRLLMRC